MIRRFLPSEEVSYSVTQSVTTVNEGNDVMFTVTSNVADGTVLYWTTTGTTDTSDFSDTTTSGTVTITSNSGTIIRSLLLDSLTDPTETIILQLRTGSMSGPIVATSGTVTVIDKTKIYAVAESSSSVEEGSSVMFTVTTTNVDDGTVLYWTTTGTSNSADFSDNTTSGTVTITSGTASITRTLLLDLLSEVPETMTLQLRTGSISGPIVATSGTVTIVNVFVEIGSSGGASGTPSTPAYLGGESREVGTYYGFDVDIDNSGNIYYLQQTCNTQFTFPLREFVSLSQSTYTLSTWGRTLSSTDNGNNLLIVKHTPSGVPIWVNAIYERGTQIYRTNIAGFDALNNVYCGVVTPGTGVKTISFSQYVSGGGNGTNISMAVSARQLSGSTISYNFSFITKYNSSGVLQWIANICGIGVGANQPSIGKSYKTDVSGNTYTLTYNSLSFPTQFNNFSSVSDGLLQYTSYGLDTYGFTSQAFVSKLNSDGQFQWVSRITRTTINGGLNVGKMTAFNSNQTRLYVPVTRSGDTGIIIESSPVVSGGIITYTASQQVAASASSYLITFNTSGNPLWVASIQGGNISNVTTDTNNNVYVTGILVGSSSLSLVLNSADSLFTVSQYGIIQGTADTYTIFIAKLNQSGVFQRASVVTISSTTTSTVNNLLCDNQNNIYSAYELSNLSDGITFKSFNGLTNGIVNLNTFGRTKSLSGTDAFYVKYDTSLNPQWIIRHDTSAGTLASSTDKGYTDAGVYFATDPTRSNSIILGGNFRGMGSQSLRMRNYTGVSNGIIQYTTGATLSSTSLSSDRVVYNTYWVRYE